MNSTDKKIYYVSLQGRSLLEDQQATAYEWRIEATPEEADQVSHLLEQLGEQETRSFLAFTYPWPDSPEQDVNAGYQSVVDALYKLIYRFGTPETREQLSRSMGYTEEE
ncbi:hypothetical protein [Paenibacillus apis]|uniref:Hydrolase n=1 Tax=Paenibacillus apis TaxID=1792174 RepID=A0A920CNU9_9BACL|nr:hypothetical protein [Paenibacillus apis]GIO43557.1 hypothetical protein J41TS4_33150 [Paenibacillus apis]